MTFTQTIQTLAVLSVAALSPGVLGADSKPVPSKVPEQHPEQVRKGVELFRETIRPAMEEHCLRCHGGEKIRGGLDLASRESLLQGGESGSVIDLGAPGESHLLHLIRHEEKPFMPAKEDRLDPALLAAFAKWIELGAHYDKPLIERDTEAGKREMKVTDNDRDFWSFRRLAPVVPPAIDDPWIRNDIDRFILSAQRREGIDHNAPADKRTLIRRAFLDLTGLPPSPKEVKEFLADTSPDAWEKLIGRLLDSEAYGPRWAGHWIDVARFAESSGFEHDTDRKSAYHYRDFLIEAFNQDLSWDQMVSWQLAGDELAPDNPLAMKATGFLAAGVFPSQLTENEFEIARYDEIDDMVGTTSLAFLGLSVSCARCHDHKYDPIPVRDYYEMAATFATAIRAEKELETEQNGKQTVMICSEGVKPIKHHADGRGYPHFYPQVNYLERGDTKQKGEVAKQDFLEVLMPASATADEWTLSPPQPDAGTSFRRATLANWMTDPQKGAGHLVARVIVNRLWQHHFGRGIVSTPNDFGLMGERPSHPELLDWLANDLIANGWKLKRIHQLMMSSAAYRQDSTSDAARIEADIDNRYLWRFAPRRLEAEAIRDSLLAVSGQLDPTSYGPGTLDPGMNRRSIYFTIKRSRPPNAMIVFDWPEHLVSIGRRSSTTIAPQSLHFMNSGEVRTYAEALAKRAGDGPLEERIGHIYELALNRPASGEEIGAAMAFLQSQSAFYPDGETQGEQRALVDFCQAILGSNEFLYLQ